MNTNFLRLSSGEDIFYTYKKNVNNSKNLLFIHGNYATSYIWTDIYQSCKEIYNVYGLDLRGFGRSSYKTPARQMKTYARDVVEFVCKLNLKNSTIIAWSAGGAVAMETLKELRGYLNEIYLVDSISTRGYDSPYRIYLDINKYTRNLFPMIDFYTNDLNPYQKIENFIPSYDEAEKYFSKYLFNFTRPKELFLKKIAQEMLLQRNNLDFWEAMTNFRMDKSVLEENKIPIKVIWGAYDKIISQEDTEEILEDFNFKAKFIKFNKSGHAPFIDQKAEFLELLYIKK